MLNTCCALSLGFHSFQTPPVALCLGLLCTSQPVSQSALFAVYLVFQGPGDAGPGINGCTCALLNVLQQHHAAGQLLCDGPQSAISAFWSPAIAAEHSHDKGPAFNGSILFCCTLLLLLLAGVVVVNAWVLQTNASSGILWQT